MKQRKGAPLRLAVVTFVTGLSLGLLVPRLPASEDAHPLPPPPVHVVSGGETLWDVALRFASGGDPRAYVEEVRRLNGLDQVLIFPGQRLVLPRR